MTDLEANLRAVQERIAAAARRAGRSPDGITLVAVTKGQPVEVIAAAYDLGLRHFGENRVEEAETKVGRLPSDITWHMIGHIQSRKARRVAPLFQVVHSVDSARLARRLNDSCAGRSEPLPVLLEVNVSGEASKYGFHPGADLLVAVEEILTLPLLRLEGLMTMAPIVADQEEARPIFARLRRLREELAAAFPQGTWRHLSMGMSDDLEVAVEEGATLVRVGRAIFDPGRPPWGPCAILPPMED